MYYNTVLNFFIFQIIDEKGLVTPPPSTPEIISTESTSNEPTYMTDVEIAAAISIPFSVIFILLSICVLVYSRRKKKKAKKFEEEMLLQQQLDLGPNFNLQEITTSGIEAFDIQFLVKLQNMFFLQANYVKNSD